MRIKKKREFCTKSKGRLCFTTVAKFRLEVNYDRVIEEMLEAGDYDSYHHEINGLNFETLKTGKAVVDVELLRASRCPSFRKIFTPISVMGFRPIDIHEILTIGEHHPDIQREDTVVAPGATWNNHVVRLDGSPSGRGVNLCQLNFCTMNNPLFAVVR